KVIFFTGYLETILPNDPLPLMAISAKSRSKFSFRNLLCGFSCILTISASPLGLAVKYSTFEPFAPFVISYSLSRVTLVTANRFTYVVPLYTFFKLHCKWCDHHLS